MGDRGAAVRAAPGASSLIIVVAQGSPPLHISGVRILGRLRVAGGELRLVDCSIERSGQGPSGGAHRRLNAPGAERALSIDGGDVGLTRTAVYGHAAGGVRVEAARLALVACTLRDCRALHGGALLVADGAHVTIVGTNITDNRADASGGAIQVSTEPSYMPAKPMPTLPKRSFPPMNQSSPSMP